MITTIISLSHVAGIFTAVHAIFHSRSSQGSTAWALSLVFIPYLTLPLYWVFGRGRFRGYVSARRATDVMHNDTAARIVRHSHEILADLPDEAGRLESLETLARMPFTRGNHAELLLDGQATFKSILDAISKAERYVLVQFYIVRDDELGRRLKDALIERARKAVRVYFLYDEIGSKLTERYLEDCRLAGVDIRPFHTTKGKKNRFQVNFRNHRKIVVVDGRTGFVGGHNVGIEYLGQDPKFGPWRDTHMRLEGPMVTGLQFVFVEDWYWASKSIPDLEWMPELSKKGDMAGLILGSGPADELETCNLMFIHAIHSAEKRCWIASPYFVPGEEVLAALQLAGLRGVDVRILLPKNPDQKMIWLASFSFLEIAAKTNIRILRYKEGFMHQKVVLVDDDVAAVGTANLDNRSFRLNFEVTGLLVDAGFAAEVEKMFLADFEKSEPADPEEYRSRNIVFKFAVKVARLLSPIL